MENKLKFLQKFSELKKKILSGHKTFFLLFFFVLLCFAVVVFAFSGGGDVVFYLPLYL